MSFFFFFFQKIGSGGSVKRKNKKVWPYKNLTRVYDVWIGKTFSMVTVLIMKNEDACQCIKMDRRLQSNMKSKIYHNKHKTELQSTKLHKAEDSIQ